MSETGLLSGLYQQAHKYADLVDRVLINIKTGYKLSDDPARKELSTLLIQTEDQSSEDLPTRLLLMVLENRNQLNQVNLAQLGKRLLAQVDVEEETIAQLESFAQALEEEQVEAMMRMRQWTR